MKKLFATVLILGLAIFSSMGCITRQVWTDNSIYGGHRLVGEKDTLLSFYLNEEKKELLFIGNKFHYIFKENTSDIIALLQAKKFLNLEANNLYIYASSQYKDSNDVESIVTLSFKQSNLSLQQKQWLLAHDFKEDRYIGYKQNREVTSPIYPQAYEPRPIIKAYNRRYHIKGLRYLSDPSINTHVVKLKQPIEIFIEAKHPVHRNTITKIALTPLTLTADIVGGAILAVGAVVMSPVWLYQKITK